MRRKVSVEITETICVDVDVPECQPHKETAMQAEEQVAKCYHGKEIRAYAVRDVKGRELWFDG